MTNQIQSIAIDRFVAHPDNPNRMSKVNFAKLVRNIKLSGRYELLVVRPCPPDQVGGKPGFFQIINGYHRWQALTQLGYKEADGVVWNIDDQQADLLLATLNRLGGSDVLDKKLALMARLNKRMETRELAKLLPQTAKQIERLGNLKTLSIPAKITASCFANTLVFFVDDPQQKMIEEALSLAESSIVHHPSSSKSIRAAALTEIAEVYLVGSGKKPM